MAAPAPYFIGNRNSTTRRPPSRSDQDPGDAIREGRLVSNRTQAGDQKAQLIAALNQQRAKAIALGVLPASLPVISASMSDADLVAAQQRITSIAPESAGIAAGNAGSSLVPQVDKTAAGQPIVAAPAPVAQPDAPMQAGTSVAVNPGEAGMSAAVRDLPRTPQPTQVAAAPPQRNPMLEAMVRDGTLPEGASLDRSGAGFSTDVRASRGPRNVMVQPTADQSLAARFPGWESMTPEQKRATLPRGVGGGEVIDTGRSAPNYKGERAVNETSGPGIEVNPREDRRQTFTDTGGMTIDPRFQVAGASPMGSASFGPATGNHYIGDETGDRTAEFSQQPADKPQMRATPPTLAPTPAATTPAPAAAPAKPPAPASPPAPQSAPVPRNMTDAPFTAPAQMPIASSGPGFMPPAEPAQRFGPLETLVNIATDSPDKLAARKQAAPPAAPSGPNIFTDSPAQMAARGQQPAPSGPAMPAGGFMPPRPSAAPRAASPLNQLVQQSPAQDARAIAGSGTPIAMPTIPGPRTAGALDRLREGNARATTPTAAPLVPPAAVAERRPPKTPPPVTPRPKQVARVEEEQFGGF